MVIWTCNHCPYALAWHDRTVDVARDYADRGVAFFAVNSNDAERYPRDSVEAMRERVEADGGGRSRTCTTRARRRREPGTRKPPHIVYVLDADGVVRYEGAPDADHQDPSQGAAWLRDALDAILEGREPELAATDPVGCSIKWKE